jgi:hypothetical protein
MLDHRSALPAILLSTLVPAIALAGADGRAGERATVAKATVTATIRSAVRIGELVAGTDSARQRPVVKGRTVRIEGREHECRTREDPPATGCRMIVFDLP